MEDIFSFIGARWILHNLLLPIFTGSFCKFYCHPRARPGLHLLFHLAAFEFISFIPGENL
jgi:hypothetical protein